MTARINSLEIFLALTATPHGKDIQFCRKHLVILYFTKFSHKFMK